MTRIRLSSVLLIFIAFYMVACSQYHTFTIENQYPPIVNIPNEIQSFTLMNRSMTDEFHEFSEDSLQQCLFQHRFNSRTTILDSLVADTCLQVIAELLFESSRFDVVIPVDRNIARNLNYSMIEKPLEWSYVEDVCNTYHTDALLVMEKYNNGVSFLQNKGTVSNESRRKELVYHGALDVDFNSFFRIYYPRRKEIVNQFFISDTLHWKRQSYSINDSLKNSTTVKQGLIEAGIKVAIDLDDHISPLWENESRQFYLLDKRNMTEKQFAEEGSWDKLAEYWEPFTKSLKNRIKHKAEFNMAVAAEQDGRINEAIVWVEKSGFSFVYVHANQYLVQLKSRSSQWDQYNRSAYVQRKFRGQTRSHFFQFGSYP